MVVAMQVKDSSAHYCGCMAYGSILSAYLMM